MHAIPLLDIGSDCGVTDDLHAGCALLHEEDRCALMNGGVGVRDDHHEKKRGEAGVGGKPLLSVDHPVISIAGGGAQKFAGICAGLRFCHRIT